MKRLLAAMAFGLLTTWAAQAHFVMVVPAKDGASVKVIFSEDLGPDENVDIKKVAGIKLRVRNDAGKESPLSHTVEKAHLAAKIPGKGQRLVFGSLQYGVMTKGDAKPYLLMYHPKAVIEHQYSEKETLGEKCPIEIVAKGVPGKVRLLVLAAGKPAGDVEVNVIKPEGAKEMLKTDASGLTPAIDVAGQFGAWAKTIEAKAGELDGKKYEEIRHYGTLVVDVGSK